MTQQFVESDPKAQVEELLKRIEEQKKSLEAAKQENLQIKVAAKGQIAALPVAGTFRAQVTVDEARVEKTFKFRDGKVTIRNHTGKNVGAIYVSELVIKMANSGSISEAELKQYPNHSQLTQAEAKAILQHLADCESALVQIVEP